MPFERQSNPLASTEGIYLVDLQGVKDLEDHDGIVLVAKVLRGTACGTMVEGLNLQEVDYICKTLALELGLKERRTRFVVCTMTYRHRPRNDHTTNFFKRITWIVGAFVMVWVVCIPSLFVFICVPVEKLWYPDLPGGCINQVGTWIDNAASTVFSDLLILLLPSPHMWGLQLRKLDKMGLTLVFGLGFL
ncbi:unnamed protein product [Clonostachys rosea f. rosea IK726]|uniref:Uncharacterized protein n=1 Tax=Clonostachys rosea f. rosea IK726 TaxID=1349383 RepID=A0ACA9U885_BIOOC|nr:unnamed protein product [Clonostachys rosea f. rosea IK726]